MPYGRHEPRPSLGSYAGGDPDWAWFYCEGLYCTYNVGIRYKTLIDRHGPDIGMDDILRRMKCPRCGHKGATMRTPSHDVNTQGWQKFPGER